MWIAVQKVPATDFQDAKPADEQDNILRKVVCSIIFVVLSGLGCLEFGELFLRYMFATFISCFLACMVAMVCFIRSGYVSMFTVYRRTASLFL